MLLFSSGVLPDRKPPNVWHFNASNRLNAVSSSVLAGWLSANTLSGQNGGARRLAEWMIHSGRLGLFSLTKRCAFSIAKQVAVRLLCLVLQALGEHRCRRTEIKVFILLSSKVSLIIITYILHTF